MGRCRPEKVREHLADAGNALYFAEMELGKLPPDLARARDTIRRHRERAAAQAHEARQAREQEPGEQEAPCLP